MRCSRSDGLNKCNTSQLTFADLSPPGFNNGLDRRFTSNGEGMDIHTEKMIEAMIDEISNEMGIGAIEDCYALGRFREMLLEMKDANNSMILRQIHYARKEFDPATCARCSRCR